MMTFIMSRGRSLPILQTGKTVLLWAANAKSVLSVLGACVKCGDEITIFCEGADETEALRNLVMVINKGLGE